MTLDKKAKWDKIYKSTEIVYTSPAEVLLENLYLLPSKGDVLELACGHAANAIYLAKLAPKTFQIEAIDFSSIIIQSLNKLAKNKRLAIKGIVRDIEKYGISNLKDTKQYDIIIVSHFLNRALFPQIVAKLKPNGLLFYQTWSQERVDKTGPSNKDFRLKKGELLTLCSPLVPITYTENSDCGDISQGLRNKAMIVARKSFNDNTIT